MTGGCRRSSRRLAARGEGSDDAWLSRGTAGGGFGQQRLELFQTETGPGFVPGCIFHRFSDGDKFGSNYSLAPSRNVLAGDAHDVHNPKMHQPNLGAVVVNDGNGGLAQRFDVNLLPELAPHAVVIPAGVLGEETAVLLRDVATHTYRIHAVQASFFAASAALVL